MKPKTTNLKYLIFTFLFAFSCHGQKQESSSEVEIIFFSADQGKSWQNRSKGLSPTAGIGLGGISASGDTLALFSKDKGLYLFHQASESWENIPTDKELLRQNPSAVLFFSRKLFVATQTNGVYQTNNLGKTWSQVNAGLESLTIRKFVVFNDQLFAGTNSGVYAFDSQTESWSKEIGSPTLQVNGFAVLDNTLYIGTNQGIFSRIKTQTGWNSVLEGISLHNVSTDQKKLFAETYNELLISPDFGQTWQSAQTGLPPTLYTFNVINHQNSTYAAQWDGVYRWNNATHSWNPASAGIPAGLAIHNLLSYNKWLVANGNPRELRPGMTLDK